MVIPTTYYQHLIWQISLCSHTLLSSPIHTHVKPTPALPCVARCIIPITPVSREYGYACLSRPNSLQPESLQSQLYPKQHLVSKNSPTQKKEKLQDLTRLTCKENMRERLRVFDARYKQMNMSPAHDADEQKLRIRI